MSKPLVLRTFNIWQSLGDALYADNDEDPRIPHNVGYEVYRKRLTSAELAAEYHQQAAYTEYWAERMTRTQDTINRDRLQTLHRFATTPHAGEPS